MTLSKKNKIKLRRAINTKIANMAEAVESGEDTPRLLPLDASRAAVTAIEGMIDSGQISIIFHLNGGEKPS